MAPNENPSKDIWDKLDVVGKLISAVVLVVIALFLKLGADNIASSLKTGQLVQSLIGDLTSKTEKIRQEIALIALNHSVGDKKGKLVAEIAERLFWDILDSPPTSTSPGREFFFQSNIALRILDQRSPKRANEIREEIKSALGLGQLPDESLSQALASLAFPSRVFIQFRNEKNRELVEALRSELLSKDFYAPEVEQIDENYANDIRFFYFLDRKLAEEVFEIVERFLKDQGSPRKLHLQYLSSPEFRDVASKGQVEVWINLDRE